MADWEQRLQIDIRNACIAEVTAEKPGNVSPTRCFQTGVIDDFLVSADIIAPILPRAANGQFGRTVLDAVAATNAAVGHNTNLGIILLLTPLACVPPDSTLADGIAEVLEHLTVDDAAFVYEAIRQAAPGGMGSTDSQDVAQQPTAGLQACMALAADRDLIAAQYANGFQQVVDFGLSLLLQTHDWTTQQEHRLGWIAVSLMAAFGDSLIRRKCGAAMEQTVQQMAQRILHADWPRSKSGWQLYEEFDDFLRQEGNSRNPGTTADMIAAILFASFREQLCVFDESSLQLQFLNSNHE